MVPCNINRSFFRTLHIVGWLVSELQGLKARSRTRYTGGRNMYACRCRHDPLRPLTHAALVSYHSDPNYRDHLD